jgi:hypothetical protein
MKLIFTLFVSVLFALVGRGQSSTTSGTVLANSGAGRTWDLSFPSSTQTINPGNPSTALLIVTGFTFPGLPANITITGFTVVVNRQTSSTNAIQDTRVSLVKAGVPVATNRAIAGAWPTTAANATYGTGTTDLWGSTWLQTDLNATFGVAIQAQRISTNSTPTINSVSVTVHYLTLAPIILTSFDISKTADNHVSIQFATASEEHVKNIFVERSSDGRNFSPIFTIAPVGARNKYTRYALTDKTPLPGTNYYRIKEIDLDGNLSYFDIKAITINKAGARFQAFHSGADIKVNLSSIKGDYILSLHDASGSQIRSKTLNIVSNSFQTTLPAPQRAGVYIVTLKGEGISETARIFVGQ